MNVAHRLFQKEGFDGTGVGRVSSEAGIAPNTLYWYFEDKDALLIAVLDRLVNDAVREYAKVQAEPLQHRVQWLFERFDSAAGLIVTVHARVSASTALREWHDRFHRMLEVMVIQLLADLGLSEGDRALAARVGTFVVEGLLSHREGGREERDAILRFVTSLLARAYANPVQSASSGARERPPAR
ncbi:MAG: TetR/AcrR family transcriptional regulator [Polyangiaceae bacterium]